MKIHRWDTTGRDVTDLPGLWSDEDIEVCQTQFSHPSITSGMHTNGAAGIWVRRIGGEWILAEEKNMHRVRIKWMSKEYFQ